MTDRTHNPFDEVHRVSCLRENLTSSSDGEGLETGLRSTLNGHEGGNPGYSQGQSYELPRQSFTRQVTFEEGRRLLGLESQRQWSDQAIARTTPALLGLYSLVCLMAHRLTTAEPLLPRSTAWYGKTQATFSDVLAFVRRAIWAEKYFKKSPFRADQVLIHREDWEVMLNQLASTA